MRFNVEGADLGAMMKLQSLFEDEMIPANRMLRTVLDEIQIDGVYEKPRRDSIYDNSSPREYVQIIDRQDLVPKLNGY